VNAERFFLEADGLEDDGVDGTHNWKVAVDSSKHSWPEMALSRRDCHPSWAHDEKNQVPCFVGTQVEVVKSMYA
jgi:hypothetical protein